MALQPKAPPSAPPPKGPLEKIQPPDFDILSDEHKERLEKAAAKAVLDEKVEAAEKAYLAAAIKRERRGKGLEEEQVTFTLDLATFCDRIVLDGVIYLHGRTYTVSKSAYESMREIAFRTWGHQLEIDGKSRTLQQARNMKITPHGVVNTSHLMRA